MSCQFPGCPFHARDSKYCPRHEVKKQKQANGIAKVSDKQKDRQKEYKKVRKEYMAENPKCEFKGCNKVSTELHHKKGRIGSNLTDKTTFIALCQDHHRLIEDNPLMAKSEGYSESRLNTRQ